MSCTCLPDIRAEARFDTMHLDPEPFIFDADAALADMLRENAKSAHPLTVCRGCNFPVHAGDLEWFWKDRLCTSCGFQRIDELLIKISKRHGRRKALKLLKALAK
jgi:hypothetical protein